MLSVHCCVGVAWHVLSGLVADRAVIELVCEFYVGLLLVVFPVAVAVCDVRGLVMQRSVVHNAGLVVVDHRLVAN